MINRYVIQKGLDRLLVLYWYQSHGRVVASEYSGKFYLDSRRGAIEPHGRRARAHHRADDGDDGETQAEAMAVQFVKTLYPALSGYLPE